MSISSVVVLLLFVVTTASGEASSIIGIRTADSSEELARREAEYLKDLDNPNSTLFDSIDHELDGGQRLLEEIYQRDKILKFDAGWKWTGKELLCNCSKGYCGPEALQSIFLRNNLPGVCVGLACYHQKRHHDGLSGITVKDEHMGCYGGDQDTHDHHDHHEPIFCSDTEAVITRCCWKSFCQASLDYFDHPPYSDKWRWWHTMLAILIFTVIGLAVFMFVTKSEKLKMILVKFSKKRVNDVERFQLMDMSGHPPCPNIIRPLYDPLNNESTTNSCSTTATFITTSSNGTDHPLNQLVKDLDDPSGTLGLSSGIGGNLQHRRTYLADAKRLEQIGQGRYGTVHKCIWRSQIIALKVLASRYERSYYREVAMYRSGLLRHTNILQFYGNDEIDSGSSLDLCMGFEYHDYGSLDNFLSHHPVDIRTAAGMIFSMASGLAFLHSPLDTTTNGKPGIAHRDFKSGNVLVKRNLMVCIADLGLSVCHVDGRIGIPTRTSNDHYEIEYKRLNEKMEKCGTMRYLCPELLDDTFDCDLFEAYKAADIFSMGLVIYEICRRTYDGKYTAVSYNESQPYFRQIAENGGIAGDVNVECMRKVLLVEKARPEFSDWWNESPFMVECMRIMNECWYTDPSMRLSANNVVRSIERLAKRESIDILQT